MRYRSQFVILPLYAKTLGMVVDHIHDGIPVHGQKLRIKPVNITVEFMRGGKQKRTFALGGVTRLG